MLEGVDDVLDDEIGADGVNEIFLVHADVVAAVISTPTDNFDDFKPDIGLFFGMVEVFAVKVLHILKQVPYFFPERHDAVNKVVELILGDVSTSGVINMRVIGLIVQITIRRQFLHFVLDDTFVELARDEEVFQVVGELEAVDETGLGYVGL